MRARARTTWTMCSARFIKTARLIFANYTVVHAYASSGGLQPNTFYLQFVVRARVRVCVYTVYGVYIIPVCIYFTHARTYVNDMCIKYTSTAVDTATGKVAEGKKRYQTVYSRVRYGFSGYRTNTHTHTHERGARTHIILTLNVNDTVGTR